MVGRITDQYLKDLVEQGLLDECYQSLVTARRWLWAMIELAPNPESFQRAASDVHRGIDQIVGFYVDYCRESQWLGPPRESGGIDVLIILACKDTDVLRRRVQGCRDLIEVNPQTILVLCGGGFNASRTESDAMLASFREMNLQVRRVVQEEDSIDTIGNAVFSNLILRREGLLEDGARIVVASSAFHMVRSHNLFRKVYGPGFDISGFLVRTTDDEGKLAKLAAHELSSDSRSSRDIFSFPDLLDFRYGTREIAPGSVVTLFYQLICNHDFYRFRYDLVRRYSEVLLNEE